MKVRRAQESDRRDAANRREEPVQILCATDLLPKTERAIARAGMIADQLHASLTLMHAFRTGREGDSQLRQQAQKALAQLRSRIGKPLSRYSTAPEVIARRGMAAEAIAATAKELEAELVVMGPHRRRIVRDPVVGTTFGQVLRTRISPVLIVRRRPDRPYRTVIIGLDLAPVSLHALRVAHKLLVSTTSTRLIVHAYPPPYINATAGFQRNWRRQAADRLTNHLSGAGIDLSRYNLVFRGARAATALIAEAKRRNADLVVVGTRKQGAGPRILGAGVARKLTQSLGCDLLIVPEKQSRKPTLVKQ